MNSLHPENPNGECISDHLAKMSTTELYRFIGALFGFPGCEHPSVAVLREAGIVAKVARYAENRLRIQFYYTERPGDLTQMVWSLVTNPHYLNGFARQGVVEFALDDQAKTAKFLGYVPGLPKARTVAQITQKRILRAFKSDQSQVVLTQKGDGTSVQGIFLNGTWTFSTNASGQLPERNREEFEYAAGRDLQSFGELLCSLLGDPAWISINFELHQKGFQLVTLHCPGTLEINHVEIPGKILSIQELEDLEHSLRSEKCRVGYRYRQVVPNDPEGEFLEFYQPALDVILRNWRVFGEEGVRVPSEADIPGLATAHPVQQIPKETDIPGLATAHPVQQIPTEADIPGLATAHPVQQIPTEAEILSSMEGWVVHYAIHEESVYLKVKTPLFKALNQLTYGKDPEIMLKIRNGLAQWVEAVRSPPSFDLESLLALLESEFTAWATDTSPKRKPFRPSRSLSEVANKMTQPLLEANRAQILQALAVDGQDPEKIFAEAIKTGGQGRINPKGCKNTYALLSTLGLPSYTLARTTGLCGLSPKIWRRFSALMDSVKCHAVSSLRAAWTIWTTPQVFVDGSVLQVTDRVQTTTEEKIAAREESVRFYEQVAQNLAAEIPSGVKVVAVDLDGTLLVPPKTSKSLQVVPHHNLDGRKVQQFSRNMIEVLRELFGDEVYFFILTGAKLNPTEVRELIPGEYREMFKTIITGSFDISPAEQKRTVMRTLASLRYDLHLLMVDDDRSVLQAVSGYAATLPAHSHPVLGTSLYPPVIHRAKVDTVGLPGSGKTTLVKKIIESLAKKGREAMHINFDDVKNQQKAEAGHEGAASALEGFIRRFMSGRPRPEDPDLLIVDTLGKHDPRNTDPNTPRLVMVPFELYELLVEFGHGMVRDPRLLETFNEWLTPERVAQWKDLCGHSVEERDCAEQLTAGASTITKAKYDKNIDPIWLGVLAGIRDAFAHSPCLIVPIRPSDLEGTADHLATAIDTYRLEQPPFRRGLWSSISFPVEKCPSGLRFTNDFPHMTVGYKIASPEEAVRHVVSSPKLTVSLGCLKTHTEKLGGNEIVHSWLSVTPPADVRVASNAPHITVSSSRPDRISSLINADAGEAIVTYSESSISSMEGLFSLYCC